MNSLSDLQQMVNGNIKRHRNSQCVGAKTLHNNLVKCPSNVSNARKLSPLRNNVLSVSDFEGSEQSTNTRPSSVQFNDRISTSDSVLSFSIEGDSVSNGSLFTSSSSNSRATSARQRRKLKLAREKSQKQVILDHEQRINLLLGEYFTVVNQQQTSNDRLHLPGENYLDFGFHETSARQALVDKLIKDIQGMVVHMRHNLFLVSLYTHQTQCACRRPPPPRPTAPRGSSSRPSLPSRSRSCSATECRWTHGRGLPTRLEN
jgi:hypothetical protein